MRASPSACGAHRLRYLSVTTTPRARLTDWLSAARPRTLPAAVAPVLVGAAVAYSTGQIRLLSTLAALIVGLALQIGVNFANDYSDGIRGTDRVRIGPQRLVASGAAAPGRVKAAAFTSFGIGALAGCYLAWTSTWWFIPIGVAAIVAAWFYTGGPRPYGYAGFGEVFVFLFFGLVAVLGTCYANCLHLPAPAWWGAAGIGLLACALLVVNNLRDIPTDTVTGKRTLAVRLGDRRTRVFYLALLVGAGLAIVAIALHQPWALVAFGALPLAIKPIRAVAGGHTGQALIGALGGTGALEFGYALLLAIGLIVP